MSLSNADMAMHVSDYTQPDSPVIAFAIVAMTVDNELIIAGSASDQVSHIQDDETGDIYMTKMGIIAAILRRAIKQYEAGEYETTETHD